MKISHLCLAIVPGASLSRGDTIILFLLARVQLTPCARSCSCPPHILVVSSLNPKNTQISARAIIPSFLHFSPFDCAAATRLFRRANKETRTVERQVVAHGKPPGSRVCPSLTDDAAVRQGSAKLYSILFAPRRSCRGRSRALWY